jgi:hypothetical protein
MRAASKATRMRTRYNQVKIAAVLVLGDVPVVEPQSVRDFCQLRVTDHPHDAQLTA